MYLFGSTRIFMYDQPVDMRKSFEGLGGLINIAYPHQLLTGSLFLFLNRYRTLIKILYWDGDGFAIWYKRLEKGIFSGCFSGKGELSRQQFTLLLEGVTPKHISRRFSLQKEQIKL